MMEEFELEKKKIKTGGQVAIIGGSKLFHGAPLLSLKTASRMVEMVFFSSPEPSVGRVAENLKSKLGSFIWVPWDEVGEYIKKSDAVLIGPGLMRYRKEGESGKWEVSREKRVRSGGKRKLDSAGVLTKRITEEFLSQFPQKQWVIDAGSLQVMDSKFIPKNAILTPNQKEYQLLFGDLKPDEAAKKYQCIIVAKNEETLVCSPEKCQVIKGGNEGLKKGGMGDVLAGLVVALVTKNPPFDAACIASFIAKKAADELYKKVGFAYNADDLAEKVPEVLGEYLR